MIGRWMDDSPIDLAALDGLSFPAPVTLEQLGNVRDRIKRAFPSASVDVSHDGRDSIVVIIDKADGHRITRAYPGRL